MLLLVFVSLLPSLSLCYNTLLVPTTTYPNLTHAWDLAISGDVIFLLPATVPCSPLQSRWPALENISIVGSGSSETVFDCSGVDLGGPLINLHGDQLSFQLENVGFRNIQKGRGFISIEANSNSRISISNISLVQSYHPMELIFPSNAENIQISVDQCYFSGNSASGLLISFGGRVFNSVVLVKGCSFFNNQGDPYQLQVNGTSSNSSFVVDGGVYSGNAGNILLGFNNTFSSSNVAVRGVTYINNTGIVVFFGGNVINSQLFVENSLFAHNSGSGGIQIWLEAVAVSTLMQFKNSTFLKNKGIQGGGAAIEFWQSATNCSINFIQTTFDSNVASTGGGGLSVQFVDLPANNNNNINNNNNNVSISIQNCSIVGNVANGMAGGCLFLLPEATSLAAQCSLCHRHQDNLWLPPSDPVCKFENSSNYCTQIAFASENYVQAYYTPVQQQAYLDIVDTTIAYNKAEQMGGGMVVSNGRILLNGNVTFQSNVAFEQAAGFYSSGSAELSFAGSILFSNNIAKSHSEFLLSSQGGVTISGQVEVFATPPFQFSVDKGFFSIITMDHTGQIILNNNSQSWLKLHCPLGYRYDSSFFTNVASFSKGWPNPMISTFISADCVACPIKSYGVAASNLTIQASQSVQENIECQECPFGAICDGGLDAILASKYYWGYLSPGPRAAWSFTRCPMGYCCNDAEGCKPRDVNSSCSVGRDPSVPLCGACLPNHSQNLTGKKCIPSDDRCNDGRWAWPFSIAIAGFWCIFALFWGKRRNPKSPDIDTSWIVPCLIFYFQNMSLLYTVANTTPVAVLGIVASITNLHFSAFSRSSSSWADICIMKGLSTEGSIAIQLAIPIMVGTMMLIVYITTRCVGFVKIARERFSHGFLSLSLLFYTTAASVCGVLLHCVEVQGNQGVKVVFAAGSVICTTGWQYGLWILYAFIVIPYPFALLYTQYWNRKQIVPKIPAMLMLESTYKRTRWYWPSLTLMKRLLIALVYSFVDDASSQGLWFTVFFVAFLLLHLSYVPHNSRSGNIVESVSLVSLTMASLFVVRSGTLIEAATSPSDSSPSGQLSSELKVISTTLFLVPVLAAIGLLSWEYIKKKLDVRKQSVHHLFFHQERTRTGTKGGFEMDRALLAGLVDDDEELAMTDARLLENSQDTDISLHDVEKKVLSLERETKEWEQKYEDLRRESTIRVSELQKEISGLRNNISIK